MTKWITLLTLTLTLFAEEIPLDTVKMHPFAKRIEANAQIIQLVNARQAVMSLVEGHIEKYFVKAGEKVTLHQKIALIDSISLSRMTSEYLSLKKQFAARNKNYLATRTLYKKGLASLEKLNEQSSAKDALLSRLNTLRTQLETLGIDTHTLSKPTSSYILRAHSSGIVANILQPLHAVVSPETKIVEIVKEQSFFLKSFVPLKYAREIRQARDITLHYLGEEIPSHITQILPNVDEHTQRIVVLSSIENNQSDLFNGAFVAATLYIPPMQNLPAVKKSALSFFNNEWVVFVPKHQTDHHEEETDHDTEAHEGEDEEDHDEHEHETDETVPYEARIVKIITEDDRFVAIEGLEAGETYVSDKSYYIKSMLLKSALGGHGH